MAEEFYFEANDKLHRATWMPTLTTWYEHIWNGSAWDYQGRLDSDEIAVARKLKISRSDAHRKYIERTAEFEIKPVTHHEIGGEA